MIVQVVRVSIEPEQREHWLEIIRLNAEQTRTEEGCESYQVGEDIETPNRFVLVEEWTTLEAQYAHFRSPEFGALMVGLADVLAEPPDVSIHDVASSLTLAEALKAAQGG